MNMACMWARLVITVALASAAGTAPAQNLLANPDFDEDAADWLLFPSSAVTHDPQLGNPAPGALRFELDLCCTAQAAQCVPAFPGDRFDFGARLRLGDVPPGSGSPIPAGDGIGMDLFFNDQSDCMGANIGGAEPSAPVGRNWTLFTADSGVAPAGTQAVFLRVRLYNFADVQDLVAHADSVFLAPSGTAEPIFGAGFEGVPP